MKAVVAVRLKAVTSVIKSSCGCECRHLAKAKHWKPKFKWCRRHGRMAEALARIMADFELMAAAERQRGTKA